MNDQRPSAPPRSPGLWAYNIRILLGNSYWLIITPVAAAQLVLFWNMAVVSMSSSPHAAGTVELVAPILAAFLCAHALAPEQRKVGELVFVRPVSVERILVLRIVAIFAFVLLSLSPVLILYHFRIAEFPLGMTLLAALPSMLLLSLLALGIASAVHHPLLGFAAAGAFWVVDLLTSGTLNPLTSLQSYAGSLSGSPFSEIWLVNKLVLLGLSALLYLWVRSMLGRPAAPLRLRVVAARSALALAILFAYVATGAGFRLGYGLQRESQMGPRAHLWYLTQFSAYGPVPVVRLFGPAFALYLEAEGAASLNGGTLGSGASNVDVSRLELLQERYPESIWADNAQFLIALNALAQPALRPAVVISCRADRDEPSVKVFGDDFDGARPEFEALVERYPDSPFAPFALSQLAVIGLSTLDLESAVSANTRLLERYPEAPEAGLAGADLSAYHLNAGHPELALEAAEVAAGLAPWDVRADVLFAAARAAQTAGKPDLARNRYTSAREAASEAGERALRGERSPSRLTKGQLFERVNAVIAASTRALAGTMGPPPAPAADTSRVTGRIVLDVSGATASRVALGSAPDANGFPSPFDPGPAVAASLGPDGAFALASVSPGPYRVLAIALSVPRDKAAWRPDVSPPSLPVEVRGTSVEMPPVGVALRPQPVRRYTPPERPDAPGRSRRGGRDSGGRGGRR